MSSGLVTGNNTSSGSCVSVITATYSGASGNSTISIAGAPIGILNFVSGNLVICGGTSTFWFGDFDISLHTDSGMLNQYNWAEIGRVGTAGKTVGAPTSYHHETTTRSSDNVLVIDSMGVSFSNAYDAPSSVCVEIPNGLGGYDSIWLKCDSSSNPYYFYEDEWVTVLTVHPGETLSWPDNNIMITAFA